MRIPKLKLRAETVRVLSGPDLLRVAGGAPWTSLTGGCSDTCAPPSDGCLPPMPSVVNSCPAFCPWPDPK